MKRKRDSKQLTLFFKKGISGKKPKLTESPQKDISKYESNLKNLADKYSMDDFKIIHLAYAMYSTEVVPMGAKYAPKQNVVLMDLQAKAEVEKYLQFFLDKNEDNTLLVITETLPQALILYGPSGSGKSSLIKCLAKVMGFKILESNASHCRNNTNIYNLLKEASQNSLVQSHC